MSCDSLKLILDFASPLVVAASAGIGLWVAHRLRGISEAEQSISQAVDRNYKLLERRLDDSGSPPGAQDRRK